MISATFRAMGSQITMIVDAHAPEAAQRLQEAPGWFEAWEQALSRFRPESELSRLNRRPGDWVGVSGALWDVTMVAIEAARASGGLVTPTALGALEAAGYDRSFEQIRAGAPARRTRVGSAPAPWTSIEVDRRRRAVRLPAGARLDLGGVAKGWAADQAMRRLAPLGPALVDAGGDIALSGPRASGEPWPIGVASPYRAGEELDLLLLSHGGVATSGRDARRWRIDGQEQHHLIDPRTGRPAQTDLLSASVVAPSIFGAELAAKVAMLLGSAGAMAWLKRRPELAALLAREDGQILTTSTLSASQWHPEHHHA